MIENSLNKSTNYFSEITGKFSPSSMLNGAYKLLNSIQDPSIMKIVSGSSMVFTGSYLLAKSNIWNRAVTYLRGDADDGELVHYRAAAGGATIVIGGLAFIFLGTSELYDRYANNLCNYRADTLCKGNLGIPRDEMPQLDKQVKTSFLETFGDQVEHMTIDATQLHATQGEINTQKVLGMVASANEGKWTPCNAEIITAINDFGDVMIVDGHHRAAACFEIGGQIPVAHINASVKDVLDLANRFEGVEQHAFNQASKL